MTEEKTKHAGGRPRGTFKNPRLRQIMEDEKCTRQWAYVLLKREIQAKKDRRKELMFTR